MNRCDDAFQILQDVFICKTQHHITLRHEPLIAFVIAPLPIGEVVALTVDFDNQSRCVTDEIRNELPHRHLTAESQSINVVRF
jgi:hypothetical protein